MANGTASMPRNEDGEFELVLGNKQLISVFLIVSVLLGVFFTMGYVVGSNSNSAHGTDRRPEPDYVRNDAPSAMGAPATRPETAETRAPRQTVAPPASEDTASQAERTAPSEPAPGQAFLQVAAVAKPEADVVFQVLQRKGFRAQLAAGPNESLQRVLVGPVHDASDISKTKADLERAGFKSFLKKY